MGLRLTVPVARSARTRVQVTEVRIGNFDNDLAPVVFVFLTEGGEVAGKFRAQQSRTVLLNDPAGILAALESGSAKSLKTEVYAALVAEGAVGNGVVT